MIAICWQGANERQGLAANLSPQSKRNVDHKVHQHQDPKECVAATIEQIEVVWSLMQMAGRCNEIPVVRGFIHSMAPLVLRNGGARLQGILEEHLRVAI
jgi:hypothetical protein